MVSPKHLDTARKEASRHRSPSPAYDGEEDQIGKTRSASQARRIQQNPHALSTGAMLHLQRTIGNLATTRLLTDGKAKHRVQGPPGDPRIMSSSPTNTIQRLITHKQLKKRAGDPIVGDTDLTEYSQVLTELRRYHTFVNVNTLGQVDSIEPNDIEQFQNQTKEKLVSVRQACQAYLKMVIDKSKRRTEIEKISADSDAELVVLDELDKQMRSDQTSQWMADVQKIYGGKNYKYIITDLRAKVSFQSDYLEFFESPKFTWGHFADFSLENIPDQGWKLHVTADKDSMVEVIQILHPLLTELKVGHKFTAGLEGYYAIATDDTQVGKVVTIYPPKDEGKEYLNTQQTRTIIPIVNQALHGRGLNGPAVPGEQLVGSCGLIYARYGRLKKGYRLKVLNEQGEPTWQREDDARNRVKPDWVPDLVV
ncbi:hypothetical protein D1BOALGB6SA_1392 [Olavius sp. associated proteobacterium Delta 1]|nr:hypothetical protein D1BOALGB6SA_1392 [Olavius sp. associated proteobacterium Delta 1]